MKRVLVLCPTRREYRDLPALARELGCELVFDEFCGDYFDRLLGHPPANLPPLDILDSIEQTIECYRNADLSGVTSGVGYPGMSVCSIIAQRLGLPGPSPASVMCCEHKYYSRLAQRALVPDAVPEFRLLDRRNPDAAAGITAFPVFLKPVKSCMSINAHRIEDQRSLREIARTALLPDAFIQPFNDMLKAYSGYPLDASCLIVESLLEGVQVSLEGYVHRGHVHVIGILDAITFPNHISFKRFQYPSRLAECVQERMKDLARRLMNGIGYDNAPFNIELFYDPATDRISIIEVNPKIASQFADLFLKVDGQSSFSLLLELACGIEPVTAHRRGNFKLAASCVLRTFENSHVLAVPMQDAIADIERRYPDALIEIHATPGTDLSNQMQDAQSFRYGLVNIGANSEQDLDEKFASIAQHLEFRLVPVRAAARNYG